MPFDPTRLPAAAAFRPILIAGLACAALAGSAGAQWTQVAGVPGVDLPAVHARGDTVVAGADTAVYVSTDAGASWQVSARVAPSLNAVSALWLGNGRLYAGTYGHGVHVSQDLGGSWAPANGGLAGGPLGSLHINHLESRGDSLLAATDGAGVFALRLSSPSGWQQFGVVPQLDQSGGVQEIGRDGSRLVLGGGANGLAHWNDAGAADWSASFLDNQGLVPGLAPTAVMATTFGCFRSATGQGSWEYVGPALGQTFESRFARRGGTVLLAINRNASAHFYSSTDHGGTWQPLETLTTCVYELAVVDTTLYAARTDGLWRRSIATVSVPAPLPGRSALEFALAGSNPIRGAARFRWRLPERAQVTLELFDAQGRRVARVLDRELEAGDHEATWEPRAAAGIYLARIRAAGRSATLKLVRVE